MMNHTITIGGLLSFLAILGGLGAGGLGALLSYLSPEGGRQGCIISAGGLALLAIGLWGIIA